MSEVDCYRAIYGDLVWEVPKYKARTMQGRRAAMYEKNLYKVILETEEFLNERR